LHRHSVIVRIQISVTHILCVILSKDKKIIFETSDFENVPPFPEWVSDIPFEDEHQKLIAIWVERVTDSVNQRLRNFLKDTRGEKTLKLAFKIFEYMWFKGVTHKENYEIFQWIPHTNLSENLVKFRRVGRPRNQKYEYKIIGGNPIPQATTLDRLLNKLVDVDLIEKRGSACEKPVFYRISLKVFEKITTPEARLDLLEQELIKRSSDVQLLSKQNLAIEWILRCNGLYIPQKTVDKWIKMWEAGERSIVLGYGPVPTPFKIRYSVN
jgi:hypothetical protein